MIWEGDNHTSPNYSNRGNEYGLYYLPSAGFDGDVFDIGGGSAYNRYLSIYNGLVNVSSPMEIDMELGVVGGEFAITADILMTETIPADDYRISFILTYYYDASYNSTVVRYAEEDFTLTSAGSTEQFQQVFTMDPTWDVANIWEWDFDGDGTFDSTQENPYHLYTEPGVYDVTLRIEVDGEFAETTSTNCITATDGSSVSGSLSGAWVSNFSPYTISGDIEIAEGDELMINPDVELIFADDVQFTVNGLLTADASDSRNDPIIFTSDSSWNGIRFFNTMEDNVLNNCEISNASVSAIKVEGDSKVDVIGCKIFDNNSTSLASIEIVGSDNVLITQNIIANNTSTSNAAGIACTASSVEITNNIIVNNTGQWGAFSFKNDSNAIMINNTIANNLSTNTTPYMMFLLNSVPVITNSIIIDNSEIYFPQSTPEITYSCVTGGFTGEGNIDADPLFAAPTTGDGTGYDGIVADWSLQAGSLCINAGNPDAMYNDVDGSRNDMGAYGGPTPYELEPTSSDDNTVNVVAINSISVYPNPFNPTANIALSINENDLQQPVSVEIFNIKGQLVKTIVNNEIVQITNFVWNGKDNNGISTSSGMYFVKMKTATSEVSKKMLLIK